MRAACASSVGFTAAQKFFWGFFKHAQSFGDFFRAVLNVSVRSNELAVDVAKDRLLWLQRKKQTSRSSEWLDITLVAVGIEIARQRRHELPFTAGPP